MGLLPSVNPTLIVFFSILMPALCSTYMLNCSEPTQPALLEALSPVFQMNDVRPVQKMTTCTNVTMHFTLYGILGVDEKAQLLITYIWAQYSWINEFISWDPVQCGTDIISLPKTKLWTPDIVINEFMDENKAPSVPYLYLHSDGTVEDSKPIKVVSSCNLNIYTFPFDIQTCTFTFNSYLLYSFDIKIFLGRSEENITQISKDVMATMGEWELLDITAQKAEQIDNTTNFYYDELEFHIRVRRRPSMYVVNLLIPSCFLITVDLFSFLLPPQNVDRSTFKMTLILGYTVFLLIMNDLLPITGNTIPLLNVFLSICLALMVASLLETILVTNLLCVSEDLAPVPRWIRVLVLQILGFLVCMPQLKKKPSASETDFTTSTVLAHIEAYNSPQETKGHPVEDRAVQELRKLAKDLQAIRLQVEQKLNGSEGSQDWVQVGFIIDRLLFGLYILFLTVSFITIVIIWVNSYSRL